MHGSRSIERKHDLVVMRKQLNVFVDLRTTVVKEKRVFYRQLLKSNRVCDGVVIIVKYEAQASNFKDQDNLLRRREVVKKFYAEI